MIKIPENAEYIIKRIEDAGYHASIVGGCVRDALLGRCADDYDITTDASPDTVRSLFERTIDTGIKHGTVTVLVGHEPYEVTTYRIDGEYRDGRHPLQVQFTDKIELDLARRDFTVNAMAYNYRDGLIDAFGGEEDLRRKVLRAVGDPYLRFTEDALRILRALRFSSVLDFDIEERTGEALRALSGNLALVSRERILVEWRKLLTGARAYDIINEYFDVILVFLPELRGITMPCRESFTSLSAEERGLLLFAASSGKDGFINASQSLKMDNKARDRGVDVLSSLITGDPKTERELRLYLIGKSRETALSAARISRALGLCSPCVERRLDEAIKGGAVLNISMLKIGGGELFALGLRGEAIGDMLARLTRAAAVGDCKNERDALIEYAKALI